MPYLVLQQAINDDGTGAAHPNAVWEFVQDLMDITDSTGSITLLPWHDAATMLAAKAGTTKDGPISQCEMTLQLNPADFAADAAYVPPAGGSFSTIVSEDLIYAVKLVKSVPGKNPDGTPMLDANNQPVMVSFFANATAMQIGS
jgi:hypothetical protein